MALSPGRRLGPYEVIAQLGAGGMGEVYRARDTRLNRDVAIKVLPASFADDADRRARFEREAQAVAALSHPNIIAIFDTGVVTDAAGLKSGPTYVVTELLDGETLRDRLQAGALPVKKAVDIAVQIARGLAAAHDKHLVHRDLKPENVFLLKDGQVKILDFGIARQAAADSGATETVAAITDPGIVMGTVGYMAPEQVRGQAVDARTDLFAFGAVLYEMVSGQPAFRRDTAADTMTAILTQDPPDLAATRADLPPALDRIIRHCLEKNANERFQNSRDIAFALEALSGSSTASSGASLRPSAPLVSWRGRIARWAAAAALCAIAAWLGFSAGTRQISTPATGLPDGWVGERLNGPVAAYTPRVSPNGQEVAFAGFSGLQSQPALLKLATNDWGLLTRDPALGNVQDFAWSRDGGRIFYNRSPSGQPNGWSISTLGGDEKILLKDTFSPEPLPDGSVLVQKFRESGLRQLYRFWPDERLEPLGVVASRKLQSIPCRAFPDGKSVVFVGRPSDAMVANAGLYVLALDSGRVRRLAPGVPIPDEFWIFPLAVSPDGVWVLFDLPAVDLHRIVAVRSDGSSGVHELFTLSRVPLGLDVGPDWSIFVDQIVQQREVRWYSRPGASPLTHPVPDSLSDSYVLPIDGSRTLVSLQFGGQKHVMVVEPGKTDVPFVPLDEASDFPATSLGKDRVALLVGSGPSRRVGIVSTSTGRIVGKIDGIDASAVVSLASSPDGRTVFYAADEVVWARPVQGGHAERVTVGNAVSVDPDGKFLIVLRQGTSRVTVVRVPLPVGSAPEREVQVQGRDLRVTTDGSLRIARAIAPGQRMLVRVVSPSSWFYPVGVLDLHTGRLELVDSAFDRDMLGAGWDDSGRIVTVAMSFQGSLWRFRPKPRREN